MFFISIIICYFTFFFIVNSKTNPVYKIIFIFVYPLFDIIIIKTKMFVDLFYFFTIVTDINIIVAYKNMKGIYFKIIVFFMFRISRCIKIIKNIIYIKYFIEFVRFFFSNKFIQLLFFKNIYRFIESLKYLFLFFQYHK